MKSVAEKQVYLIIHTPGKRDHMGVDGSLLEHRLYRGVRIGGLPNILSTRDPLQSNRHIQTESEALCAKGNQKKARVIIII